MARPPQYRATQGGAGLPPVRPNPDDFWGRLLAWMRPGNLRLIALVILAILGWIGILPKDEIRGPAIVVDGDSMTILGDRIRLYAIDAPELHQPCSQGGECGSRARDHLVKVINGRSLVCEKLDTDRYGRDVAQCFIDQAPESGKPVKGEDIARAMVRDGQAMAYRKIDGRYAADEPASFDFDPPWDWRETHGRD